MLIIIQLNSSRMASSTSNVSERTLAPRPDAVYGFVCGLYGSSLLTPGIMLALSQYFDDAAVLYGGFLASLAVCSALIGWVVSRMSGVAVKLGSTDAVWVLLVLPFGWFGGIFGAASLWSSPPPIAIPLSIFGTGGGVFLGILLVVMSRSRHAVYVLEDALELVEWEARWPARWRKLGTVILIVTFGLGAIGAVSVFVFSSEWGWALYYVMFIGIPFMNLLNPRTFLVTDAGLSVGNPVLQHFRPWSAFEGFDRTEDTLVICSAVWWRPSYRCDIRDIEDAKAVVGALDDVFSP